MISAYRARKLFLLVFLLLCILLLYSRCNKLVHVAEPINSVTSEQTFGTEANATQALFGIYSGMSGGIGLASFSNYYTTYCTSLSSDELTDRTAGNEYGELFLTNNLNSQITTSNAVSSYFWRPAYYDIYEANAIISGVQASTGITAATKSQLIGEAKFLRAFCYFYLTNIFGEVPLVLSADFNQTVLLAKATEAQIYQQIVADLLDAQNSLPGDYSLTNGQPIRANKWAATALLARVYLYLPQSNYGGADSAASAIINSGQFWLVPLPVVPSNGLPPSDSDVFAANSGEAIFQLQTGVNYPYATFEGSNFIPYDSTARPNVWITPQLLAAFEPNDMRRVDWVDSSDVSGAYYYYPYKYKVRVGSGYPCPENYTILRLAEQYLIRAEAEANLGQPSAAISDLNVIRGRAGLADYSGSTVKDSVIDAIYRENRIEFFAELGHRWFDLKRWGIAIPSLDTISYKRGNIDSTQLLYPIPINEIQIDPNLTQNPGYQQ